MQPNALTLSPHLHFPLNAVTQTFAILGIRGSGKTSTAVVLAEELLSANQQVIILDPVDVLWGLRSSATGRDSGFPITILGGDHADLPLEASAGALLADFAVDTGTSLILSVRHMSMSDKFPGPDGCNFIEAEDENGKSVNAGEWRRRADGNVELVVTCQEAPTYMITGNQIFNSAPE